jgi:hypothetical protein
VSDKIKRAARARMAETGEPYSVARRAVIEDHQTCRKCGQPVSGKPEKRLNRTRRPDGAGFDHYACEDASGKYRPGERAEYLSETKRAVQDSLSLGART